MSIFANFVPEIAWMGSYTGICYVNGNTLASEVLSAPEKGERGALHVPKSTSLPDLRLPHNYECLSNFTDTMDKVNRISMPISRRLA